MRMTMLELVQSIMSDMDSDSLDSITDTDEGSQVASTIRDVYWQLVTNQTIPEHKKLFQLTDAGATPKVFMLIPTTVRRIDSVKYNKIESGDTDAAWADIKYKTPEDFLNLLTARTTTDTNVVSATDPTSSIALDMVVNDAGPSWWTSFDDEYLVFDSYDVGVDASGLVGTKTLCWGSVEPTFTVANSIDDDFTPDLDDHLFPLLLAEAKSTCFINMKQTSNPKIERQARNQKVYAQNDKHRTRASERAATGSVGPDFGRRRR